MIDLNTTLARALANCGSVQAWILEIVLGSILHFRDTAIVLRRHRGGRTNQSDLGGWWEIPPRGWLLGLKLVFMPCESIGCVASGVNGSNALVPALDTDKGCDGVLHCGGGGEKTD